MPPRLSPESQKQIDDGWDGALTPANKLGHQELLDVLVGVQLYQFGVDALAFRAEKRFAGGTVVMEVSYDRTRPNDDRFAVTVRDPSGKVVRTDHYNRNEIDATYHDLFGVRPSVADRAAEVPVRRADHVARWEKIRSLFPEAKNDQAGGAPNPGPKD